MSDLENNRNLNKKDKKKRKIDSESFVLILAVQLNQDFCFSGQQPGC